MTTKRCLPRRKLRVLRKYNRLLSKYSFTICSWISLSWTTRGTYSKTQRTEWSQVFWYFRGTARATMHTVWWPRNGVPSRSAISSIKLTRRFVVMYNMPLYMWYTMKAVVLIHNDQLRTYQTRRTAWFRFRQNNNVCGTNLVGMVQNTARDASPVNKSYYNFSSHVAIWCSLPVLWDIYGWERKWCDSDAKNEQQRILRSHNGQPRAHTTGVRLATNTECWHYWLCVDRTSFPFMVFCSRVNCSSENSTRRNRSPLDLGCNHLFTHCSGWVLCISLFLGRK